MESIRESTFNNCTTLESVSLPSTLKSIATFAFTSCTSLKNVVIPNNVKSIGEHAFGTCSNLESVTIGSGLETIDGKWVFANCGKLTTVTIDSQFVVDMLTSSTDAGKLISNAKTINVKQGLNPTSYLTGLSSGGTKVIGTTTYNVYTK